MLSPLRDLFAAVFFVAIGLSVDPGDLVPMLPAALALAAVTAATKVCDRRLRRPSRRCGSARSVRAGTALIARGEFSLVIIGLVGRIESPPIGVVATPYVFVLAIRSGGDAPGGRRLP